jgi:hypothetical protein
MDLDPGDRKHVDPVDPNPVPDPVNKYDFRCYQSLSMFFKPEVNLNVVCQPGGKQKYKTFRRIFF